MPRVNRLARNKGFTIIEIMIVLAIAALIMLIVFFALRNAGINRRDYQRKQYARRVFAEFSNYYSNNQRYPGTAAERQKFIDEYLPKEEDPTTGVVFVPTFRGPTDPHAGIPGVGQVFMQSAHWCASSGGAIEVPGDVITGSDVNTNKYVVWIGTEHGEFFCLDNYFDN